MAFTPLGITTPATHCPRKSLRNRISPQVEINGTRATKRASAESILVDSGKKPFKIIQHPFFKKTSGTDEALFMVDTGKHLEMKVLR
ncbi:hypothetical protein CDAR_182751 [Caerostris darwini]|uniref:Uncharacterized protein n=1 Tax=Caerostris darwini TaxID=1538125 RepID=A0AAV4SLI0_9ARAC|nr:hypothetical protein CDAR_182751 [Caerostris darwini]